MELVSVSLHQQGNPVRIPLKAGRKLSKRTLSSQFSGSTGLKYFQDGWNAVECNEEDFFIPNHINDFVVVTEHTDRTRQILSNTSFAAQVASTFRTSRALPRVLPPITTPPSKKIFKKTLKNFSETYKVVFLKKSQLPTNFRKENILLEGMIKITLHDEESLIKTNLKALLEGTGINVSDDCDIEILSYAAKRLSIPHVASDFTWNGEQIRANVGQGKLYVMVSSNKERLSESSSTDSLPDLDLGPKKEGTGMHDLDVKYEGPVSMEQKSCPSEDSPSQNCDPNTAGRSTDRVAATFAETGTPTVQFRCRSLSLQHRRLHSSSPLATCSSQDYIDIVDSEDEELERAIHESIREFEQKKISPVKNTSSLEDIIRNFQEKAVDNTKTELIIFRRKVLESAFRGIQRPTFKLNSRVYVKFSGEIGQDHGGPRREFFRLALKELEMSPLFEGVDGNRIFTHNVQLLEENKYLIAGRLVALSFAQEGPSPRFFNEVLFDLMVGGKVNILEDLREKLGGILPEKMIEITEQMIGISTDIQREKFLIDHGDWIAAHGGIPNVWQISEKNAKDMAERLIKHHIFYRTSSAINQFKTGMDDVAGFWQLVAANSTQFKTLFCHQCLSLNKEQFQSLFKINFSEEGSNKRSFEEETMYSWELFLQDVCDGNIQATLEELLSFITGADQIPPTGFSKCIDIIFYATETGLKRLPHASTCSLEFYLPRGVGDPNIFKEMMLMSLKECIGFEKI